MDIGASEAEEPDTAANFALMLETACRDFEALLELVRGNARIEAADWRTQMSVSAAINMSLTKSFLFHVIRAGRICEHGGGELKLDRIERRQFKAIVDSALPVRDVNEHGYDRQRKGGGDVTRPSIHLHDGFSVALDETSLTILGELEILMGPLNLRTVYDRVKPFQEKFGFTSLGQPVTPPKSA